MIETALPKLLPSVNVLSRADKLRLIQHLAAELAQEEGIMPSSGAAYPIWTPQHAFEAAQQLLNTLETAEGAGR